MKWFKYFFIFLAFVYGIFCLTLYFGQEKLLFYPSTLPSNYLPWKGQEVWIPVEKDVRLHAAIVKQKEPQGAILYLHGNKGSLRRCLAQISQFEKLGYDVLVPDYRSYGKSEGTITSQEQMYADAQFMYDYLHQRYDRIIIVGYSMGTGMASFLAANNPTEALLLIAPYLSLVDMKDRFMPFVPNFLLKYHFHTDLNLSKVTCPVTMVHGEADEVIPFDSATQLQSMYPHIGLINLPNVGHRRVIFHQAVGRAMKLLISK